MGLSRVAAVLGVVGIVGVGLVVGSPSASAATCADVDVSVARGTFEPGTLGVIVGDPVYAALQKALPGKALSAYPVNYPADLGEPASVQKGNADLVSHVSSQAAACPNQRFVLVGYSQGANVVDNSLGVSSDGAIVGGPIVATIPGGLAPRVLAVLQFGNPIRSIGRSITGTYASRTKDYCASGDPICQAGGTNFLAHFSYGGDASDAAAFVASQR